MYSIKNDKAIKIYCKNKKKADFALAKSKSVWHITTPMPTPCQYLQS